MFRYINVFFLLFVSLTLRGEFITIYNDNGNGGIHQSIAQLVVDEGQYYVDMPVSTYNGNSKIEHLKVYRVKDSARLLYRQAKWAEKYMYVVERGSYTTAYYYFNMESEWRPSLTEDPDDPDRVIPIKKLMVYRDFNGNQEAMKVVLIKSQGKYMLYFGDDYFAAVVESNATPLDFAPSWSRSFECRSKISGFDVFFNIR